MRAVLVIEQDTLIRELMREHLEVEGYATCAVASVEIGLNASRWTEFGLVLLGFATAADATDPQLKALRGLGAPVIMMRSAPAGTVIDTAGEVEQVVWSPFDLTTLTHAVRRFVPPEQGPEVTESGTYVKTDPNERSIGEISTLPAPPDEQQPSRGRKKAYSLDVLGAIVLEATGGTKRKRSAR